MRTICEVCEHKGWTLHAAHARSTHVHVVVSGEGKPERMLNAFKSWCTRRLRDDAWNVERVWSRHGSTRWLWDEGKLAEKVCYVLDGQGEPMAPWPEKTE